MTKNSNRDEFLHIHGISQDEFLNTTLAWEELEAIREDHEKNKTNLSRAGDTVAEFLRGVLAVHSVKTRVKNSEHLVAKIIRKRIEEPERIIDAKNYKEQITDLVGVRALHLFKQNWPAIHEALVDEYNFFEPPVAYYRNGDAPEILEQFKKVGCEPQVHKRHYRSVHYLLKTQINKKSPTIVEAQVRTVFEEGWAEIDHVVRYPRKSNDQVIAAFIGIFNMLSGGADEMASFLMTLKAHLTAQQAEMLGAQAALAAKTTELDNTISKLKLTVKEKEALKKQITEVTAPTVGVSWPNLRDSDAYQSIMDSINKYKLATDALPTLSTDFLLKSPDWANMVNPILKRESVVCASGHSWQVSGVLGKYGSMCPTCGKPAI